MIPLPCIQESMHKSKLWRLTTATGENIPSLAGAAASIIFVASRHALSRQNYVFRDKILLTRTFDKIFLSRQTQAYFCRDKRLFCSDKHMFIATKVTVWAAIRYWQSVDYLGEPVWPIGKAIGWWAAGPRFDTTSARLSSKSPWFVDTVLWLCPSQ